MAGGEEIKVLMNLSDRISANAEALKARPTHKEVLEEVGDLRKDLTATRETLSATDQKLTSTMERLDNAILAMEAAAQTKMSPPTWDLISRALILIIAVIAILVGQTEVASNIL